MAGEKDHANFHRHVAAGDSPGPSSPDACVRDGLRAGT